MKALNNYFFGEDTISFSDAAYFYGTYAATAAIAIYTMFSIY
ncbi:hypothetical protein [Planococcus beigongshangi]|nr:hypothetical protein [Planococcus beigongshangi]